MSRSRHRSAGEDSLELLLDPICNMFGTIMFVALIAALLAMSRSSEVVAEAVSAAERQRRSNFDRLDSRAQELEAMLQSMPSEAEESLDSAAADRVERAIGEIARRERIVSQYDETIASARSDMRQIATRIDPMREEVQRVREALDAAQRAKDRKLRTPLEREVDRFEFTVILWQDRLYAVCDLSSRERDACEWLRTWNPRHVVVNRCSTPVYECSRVRIHIVRSIFLREDSGIPVSDLQSLRSHPEFIALLASLDPREDLIGMVVAPDSFDAFAVVKQVFLSEGFNYSVEPCEQPLPTYKDSWIPGNPRGL